MKHAILVVCLAAACAPPPPARAAKAAAQVAAVLHCDGRTDNVTALNQGLVQGGLITLPSGVCMTSGTVRIPANTTLVGAGVGTTIIRAFPGMQSFTIWFKGKVNISNLTVDGGATQIHYGAAAIDADLGSDGSVIHDLEVLNAGDMGIRVQSANVQVLRTYSHDNWKQGIYVVGDQPTNTRVGGDSVVGNTLRNNVLGLNPLGQPGDGIDIDQLTQNVTVQGNTVYNNDIILTEDGSVPDKTGNTRATGHVVTGNASYNGQKNGVTLSGHIDAFTVSGNTIDNVTGFGVTVHGDSRGGRVINNTIDGATSSGVNVAPLTASSTAPTGILISGNTIENMAAGAPAVSVTGGATDITVTDNMLSAPVDTNGAGRGTVVQGNQE